ncbi:MAG: gfo/Idh/MocA family oxidoreductase, partial [Candidatus Heimdallarchaeota archaeon]|nr:gfo/Idh/MocA family oxidoreductase [Candidatus Heimdallarchaeota archaeon]
LIGRCVEEFGIGETLKIATPDNIEFRTVDIPDRLYPPEYSKDESWRHLYFGNLVQSFVNDLLVNQEPECNFYAGAKSLEVQEAVYLSHLKKKWIQLPLE